MSERMPITAVLLPGIDGTGRMFGPFIEKLPSWLSPQVIAYPGLQQLSYVQLTTLVLSQLPVAGPFILIAESFAGPLALQLTTKAGPNLKAVVLCATFVSNPRPHLARLAPLLLQEPILSRPPQKWLARLFVTGFDAPDAMLEQALEIHRHVSVPVILHRLHEVIHVDVGAILRHCRLPILHLYALHDHLILQHATREIQQLRPDIPSIGIDGPHYLLQTRPKQCMTAIKKFLYENAIVN
jgi:pimeloyl-[acyl-carrier protein] methyl ester esterase